MTGQVTAMGIRDGDPAVLRALVDRRGFAVLAYCERACEPGLGPEAAADAFTRFRAVVVGAAQPSRLDPEAALLSATRHAAAERSPRPDGPPAGPLGRLLGGKAPADLLASLPEMLAARADGTLERADEGRLNRLLDGSAAARAVEERFLAAEHAYRTAPHRPLPDRLAAGIVDTMGSGPTNGQPAAPQPAVTATGGAQDASGFVPFDADEDTFDPARIVPPVSQATAEPDDPRLTHAFLDPGEPSDAADAVPGDRPAAANGDDDMPGEGAPEVEDAPDPVEEPQVVADEEPVAEADPVEEPQSVPDEDPVAEADPVEPEPEPEPEPVAASEPEDELSPTEEWSLPPEELGDEHAHDVEVAAARLHAPDEDEHEEAAHLQSASGAVDEPLVETGPADRVAEAAAQLHRPHPVPAGSVSAAEASAAPIPVALGGATPPPDAPAAAAARGLPRLPAERHAIPAKTALAPAAAVVTIAAIGALVASGVFGGNDPSPPLDTGIVRPRALQAVPEGEAATVVDDLRTAATEARRRRLADRRQALAEAQLAPEPAPEATTDDARSGDTGDDTQTPAPEQQEQPQQQEQAPDVTPAPEDDPETGNGGAPGADGAGTPEPDADGVGTATP